MDLQEYADQLSKQWLGDDYRVTQLPGPAAPSVRKYYKYHKGYDFATPVGTPVKAPIKGKVVYAGWDNRGWGNRVGVYNPETGKTTFLSHLSKVLVKPNTEVTPGTVLAYTGNTGNSTGPHIDITEYGGVPKLPPSVQTYSKISMLPAKRQTVDFKDVIKKAKEMYSGKNLIAVSSNPERLKKLGRKGKIVRFTI